ncbi:MAG: hypothetical protein HY684_01945 [Chloroflexi bacterium]|nr:hypothetical protein [Chloroflexota bacterium]
MKVAPLRLDRSLSASRVRRLMTSRPPADALPRAWLRAAVAALMVAGLFAVLVAIARLPGIQGVVGPSYYRLALVAHVAFSLNIWLLAFAAVLWTLLPTRLLGVEPDWRIGWAAFLASLLGIVLMIGATVAGVGTPALVDYLPMLVHPLFVSGLFIFLGGVAVTAVNYVAALGAHRGALPAEAKVMRVAAVIFVMALVTLWAASYRGLGADLESAVWGAGHLLQIVNAAGLVAGWLLLSPPGLGRGERALIAGLATLCLLPAVVVPLMHLPFVPVDLARMGLVSWAGLVPMTTLAWALVGRNIWVQRQRASVPAALPVSMALFAVGVALAAFGLEGDTRVTAHYHGTVGAVTVAFMGLAFRFVPALRLGPGRPRLERVQVLLYGGGLLALMIGMYWGGLTGATRKAFESFSPDPGLLGPTLFVLTGALAAVAGGALFVVGIGWDLVRKPSPVARQARTRS